MLSLVWREKLYISKKEKKGKVFVLIEYLPLFLKFKQRDLPIGKIGDVFKPCSYEV